MIYILCDEIDSGKSTFVLELAKSLIRQNKKISGWITPAHMDGGKKAGHDFIAIDGNISDRIPFTRLHRFEYSFKWRRFYFNREVFEIAKHLNMDCEFFIMDEIGPLEIEGKAGFHDAMNMALSKSKNVLMVVRAGMEKAISKLTAHQGAKTFDLKSVNADDDTCRPRSDLITRCISKTS